MNRKILIYSLSLVLAMVALFGLLGRMSANNDLSAAKFASMARFATFASNQFEAGNVDQLDEAEAPFIFGIQIHNRQGEVIYESPQFRNLFRSIPFDHHELNEQIVTTGTGQKVFIYTRYSGDIPGYVSIVSRADQGLVKSKWPQYLLIGALLSLGVMLLGSRIASQKVHTILERFQSLFQDIRSGNRSTHVVVQDDGDLGAVAHAANAMVEHVDQLIARMNRQAIENEAVFGSIAIGVMAVDRKKQILRANPQAGQIFSFDPETVVNKNLVEVVRNASMIDTVDQLLRQGKQRVMEDQQRIGYADIRVLASPIIDKSITQGVVLTFEDVTEQSKLQEMRRDFVANVSHELKTPLTSIKGFSETMMTQEVDPATRGRFLTIINHEVDRLNDLVSDLFVLSEIEKDERSNSNKELFRPQNTLESIREMVTAMANQHPGMDLLLDIEPSDSLLFGNASLFKQLVMNLVENAFKYTKPTGGKVTIMSSQVGDDFVIQVKDEGIGIHPVDAARIFERFYRVDKSRSLDVPGTGLGLAIVKHIVISFRGSIEVESQVGEGSTFIVRLPVAS